MVTGQQIVLYGDYGPSTVVESQSWSVPGTTVGGFTNSSSGGPTPTGFSQQTNTFYWMVPATSQAVTFTLQYVNSQTSQVQTATAQTTFNIYGPSNVQIGLFAEGAPHILNNGTTNALIEFGDPSGTPGIQWSGSATSPSQAVGTYGWAQILANNSYSYNSGTPPPCNGPTGLDNQFPLPITTGTFTDSPNRSLPSADTKFTWTWNATTYFIWNPGSANSIWVTLGQRNWQFYIDTTQNVSTHVWTVQADSNSFDLSTVLLK